MNFLIHGTIADIDKTTSDDPYHPARVLVVEAGGTLSRVVVPHSVLNDRLTLLCVGRSVEIACEGGAWSYGRRPRLVATDLKLTDVTH